MTWQPIETAPRTSDDNFLLLLPGHTEDYRSRVYIGFWGTGGYNDNVPGWYDYAGGLSAAHDGHEDFSLLAPSHWMPFPPQPDDNN